MTAAKTAVFVIDDDPSVRDALCTFLTAAGYEVREFASGLDFLAQGFPSSGCIVTDVRMPEMDGLALQEEIVRRGNGVPMILMTGQGDVPVAVRAMKAGAVDFIEKPFDEAAMLQSIERALEIGKHAQDQFAATRSARSAIERLTPRERDVLGHLVDGHPNKIIAYRLGISPRTVEIHRARIMQKCKVRSLSELVRTALAARQS